MRYLHTMIRVTDLDASLDFFTKKFGLVETRRVVNDKGRFTLVFLAASEDVETGKAHQAPLVELTYNWDPEAYAGGRNFGHLAYEVDDIYALCAKLAGRGGDDQPSAARRPHGVHPHPRQHLDRAVAERRRQGPRRAVGVEAEHRGVVSFREVLPTDVDPPALLPSLSRAGSRQGEGRLKKGWRPHRRFATPTSSSRARISRVAPVRSLVGRPESTQRRRSLNRQIHHPAN